MAEYTYAEDLKRLTQDICPACESIYEPKPLGDNVKLDDLVGRRIHEVRINDDKTVIAFETCDGRAAFYTEGDCCSNSWIEHVQNAENLAGAIVLSVDHIDMPNPDDQSQGEYVQAYGLKIGLGNGIGNGIGARHPFELEYRNASNGYYGGWIQPTSMTPKQWSEMLPLSVDF